MEIDKICFLFIVSFKIVGIFLLFISSQTDYFISWHISLPRRREIGLSLEQ